MSNSGEKREAGRSVEYIESVDDLDNRIRAHKLFSKTSLDAVLTACLEKVGNGSSILDLGCGSGNFYELLSSKAKCYLGVDISQSLLNQFRSQRGQGVILINASMDDLPLFHSGCFDAIFSVYSIYYSARPSDLIANLHTALSINGYLFVVGPSKGEHATEINEFCKTIANGNAPVVEKETRIDNFHVNILPQIFQEFSTASSEEIDGSLYFPSPGEWAKYVSSTPQVRECSGLDTAHLIKLATEYSETNDCRSVSKYITVVTARR